MSEIIINGGKRLSGRVSVQGAKNSVLPVLAGTVLCGGESVVHNCPMLSDVETSLKILEHLGCKCRREGGAVIVDSSGISEYDIPDSLMREMRSSVVFLGAVIGRMGRAVISRPGGCELGPRPIDLHLAALEKLGVTIEEDHGYLECTVRDRLRGTRIALPFPSVGATENIMIAATLAQGETVIKNAAREPEISDLAAFLNACGARVCITADGDLHITGVKELHAAEHRVIPDRIAAATYLSAAAATGGDVELTDVCTEHLAAVLPCFEEMGCALHVAPDKVHLCAPKRLHPLRSVRTMPYPGFPTDAQSPLMAAACLADGNSVFIENIFESRYKHAGELNRLGAKIKLEGKVAVIEGVPQLSGAPVSAEDLRGGAALVIAGLAAQGETQVMHPQYIDRGYAHFEENLRALGADVYRI